MTRIGTSACAFRTALAFFVAAFPVAVVGQNPAKLPAPSLKSQAVSDRVVPMYFEENHGQVGSDVHFMARGLGYTALLTGNEAILNYVPTGKNTREATVHLSLAGRSESSSQPQGNQRLEGVVNYLIGSDSSKWLTRIPTYGQVNYDAVYPGVDLVYRGTGPELEFDFHVKPGADPAQIRMVYSGASAMRIDSAGDLVLDTSAGPEKMLKPVIYQQSGHERVLIAGDYKLLGNGEVGFQLGAYDRSQPLVIDPVAAVLTVKYSTYLGSGSGNDTFRSISVDAAGEAFVCGNTSSTSFPTSSTAYRKTFPSGITTVGFVTALNAAGTGIKYSTYIAGTSTTVSNNGTLNGIAVDSTGFAFVGGATDDTTFPTTKAFQASLVGLQGAPSNFDHQDGIVFELAQDGASLVYSTFLGGADPYNSVNAIAVDSSNNAYVTGTLQAYTSSNGNSHPAHFPTTGGAVWGAFNQNDIGAGFDDAFAVKIAPPSGGNASRTYSTVIGSASASVPITYGTAIAVDTQGNAYITGSSNGNIADHGGTITTQTNMTNVNPAPSSEYINNTWVLELNASGSTAVYIDYLGGNSPGISGGFGPNTTPVGIAVDAAGQAYVAGTTQTSNFQTTANAYQASRQLAGVTSTATGSTTYQSDGYITIIPSSGVGGFVYSTYLNGTTESTLAKNTDQVDGSLAMTGIAVGTGGQFTVTGATDTTNFPTVSTSAPGTPVMTSFPSNKDFAVFVTKFQPPLTTGAGLVYSEFLGAGGENNPNGIASNGTDIYVMLPEYSSGLSTSGAYDGTVTANGKELIVRLQDGTIVAATTTSVSAASATTSSSTRSIGLTSTISSTSTVNGGTVTYTVTNSSSTQVGSSVTSGAVASGAAPSVNYTLPANTPSGSYTITAVYSGTAGFTGSTGTATLTVNAVPSATQAIASKALTQNYTAPSFTPVTGGSGTAPLAYTISPSLPTGLNFSSSTGAITGPPSTTSAATTYTITVTDANGVTASNTFSLTVNPAVNATQIIASTSLTQNHPTPPDFTPVTGGGGTGTLTYTISPSLPPGLSINSITGAITGLPSAATPPLTYTVAVTDSNGATATNNFLLTVNPAVTTTQIMASTSLTQNHATSGFTPVIGIGGTGTLAYTITPSLPTGLNLNGNTGAITGTPSIPTPMFVYTVTVTDSNGATATNIFSLTVNPAVTATQAVASSSLTQNHTAAPFTPVTGGGGTAPLTFTVSPSLPTGLSLGSGTGVITGLPITTSPATTYTITVTDSNGATATSTFSLTVNAAVTAAQLVASTSLTQNYPTTGFIPVTGAAGTGTLTYTVSPSLPAGLSFSSSTGAITGSSSTTSSATNYTVTVTDANGATATNTFSLTVNPAVTATQGIASKSLTQNRAATSFTPVTGGGGTGTLVYTISPSLPTGLSLSGSTGVITGTPSITLSATTYAVTMTDSNGATATNVFSLTVNPAVTATQAVAVVSLTQNHAATSFTPVTGGGGTGSLTYSVSPALPTALALNTATGAITGTPASASAAATFTVTVTDTNGAAATAAFSLAVNTPVIATPSISSSSTTITQNQTGTNFTPVTGNGGTGTLTYSVSPALPAGLTLNPSTGAITGTPTGMIPATTFTVTVTDANGATATVTFSLTILGAQMITFAPPTSPIIYSLAPITLSATGGASGNPVTFSIVSGPGSLSGTNNGTLTVTGVGTIVIAANQTGNGTYAVAPQVTQSVVINSAPQTITFAPASVVTYGVAPITLSATGGASGNPVTFALVSGPATLNGNVLTFTGAGSVMVTASQTGNANYLAATPVTATIVVNKATPAVAFVPSVNPVLVQNAVTFTATVSSSASTPTGSVSFYDNTAGAALGSGSLTGGIATFTTSALSVGTHSITAIYSGDTNFVTITSAAVTQTILDFSLSISGSSTTSATIVPGGTATYNFTISPIGATTFPAAINLSLSGLPTGATYTFTPPGISAGAGATNFVLSIHVPQQIAQLEKRNDIGKGLGTLTLALLLLPFSRRIRGRAKSLSRLGLTVLLLLASAGAFAGLTGCGTDTGFFGTAPKTYTVTITGTSGALTRSTNVTLTVE